MTSKQILVKRRGHVEEYDSRKVYASVYAAALASHHTEEEAEDYADDVQKVVDKKVSRREEISSEIIRDMIVEALGGPGNDVAYMYLHHLNIN